MDSVLTFGKYKGETLRSVYKQDEKYFYWLVKSDLVHPKICLNDEVPFGKYKGMQFGRIASIDGSYFDFLLKLLEYEFSYESTDWTDIYDKDACPPEDGVYVLACRGDMHIYYSIFKLTPNDKFWECDELGDNCLAYHKVPEISAEKTEGWCMKADFNPDEHRVLEIIVGVDLKEDMTVINMGLYGHDPIYGIYIGDNEDLINTAYHTIFKYSEGMHAHHNEVAGF